MFSTFTTNLLRRNRKAINKLIKYYTDKVNGIDYDIACPLCLEIRACDKCIWSLHEHLPIRATYADTRALYHCAKYAYEGLLPSRVRTRTDVDKKIVKLRLQDLKDWKTLVCNEILKRQGNLK